MLKRAILMGVPLRHVLDEYPVHPMRVRLVAQLDNDVFRVDAEEGTFALRHHRPDAGQDQVTCEMQWLEHVSREMGNRVPRPLRRRDGGLVSLHNGRAVSVLVWVQGRAPRKPTARLATEIGKLLGELHALNESFRPPVGFPMRHWDTTDLFGVSWLRRLEVAYPLMDTASQNLVSRRAAAVQRAFPSDEVGVLHGDMIGSNCLWQQGALGAIDFANSGVGPFAFDIAVAMRHLPPAIRPMVISGYRSSFRLSSTQELTIPALIQARMLNMVSYAGDRFEAPAGTYDPRRLVEFALDALRKEQEL